MAHTPHILPDLSQTSDALQIGDDTVGTVVKSQSNGILKVLLQDLVTLGKVKIAVGVDPDDAVAVAQHAALEARVGALETLLASDDLNLNEAQEWVDFMKNNSTDIASLSSNLNATIAAVQADVNQNEADADAAVAGLDARVVVLETFESLIDSAISVVNDNGKEDLVVEHDINVQENWYSNGTKVLNAARTLSNIVAVDAGTDTVLSATGIAYTDSLELKQAMRYKEVLHSSSATAYFGALLKQDTYVTSLVVKVTTPFDNNTTLSLGHDTDVSYFGSLSAANMAQVGHYEIPIALKLGADIQAKYTLTGVPTQGALEIFLKPTS